jgi:flagellar hook-associated protein 2
MATDYLSALNVGSGLNTTEIIDSLVNAIQSPKENIIETKIEERNLSISAFSQLKTNLSSFDNILSSLSGLNGAKASTSNSSSVNIEISDPSAVYSFSHSIEVDNLASSQTLMFSGYTSLSDELGSGSLEFSFGTWSGGTFTNNSSSSQTIDIAEGDNLSDIKNAINDADIGVIATILQVGDDTYNLILTSDTGADNAISISATETVAGSGLAALDYSVYDSSVEIRSAADANFKIDGVSITRSTNSISDLLDGVTISLVDETAAAETISVEYETSNALEVFTAFVNSVNDISSTLRGLNDRGLDGNAKGPLVGDPIIRKLIQDISTITTNPIYGYDDSAIYLTNFGVLTNRDGSLSIDEDKFRTSFENNPSSFSSIVQSKISSSTSSVSGAYTGTNWEPGVYGLIIDNANNAIIDGDIMTLSGDIYKSLSGNTNGLELTVAENVSSADIYMGRSALDSLKIIIDRYLSVDSDINDRITRFSEDISNYEDEKSSLNQSMEILRSNYQSKFTMLNSVMQSTKNTQTSIESMMDAWKANMNN